MDLSPQTSLASGLGRNKVIFSFQLRTRTQGPCPYTPDLFLSPAVIVTCTDFELM